MLGKHKVNDSAFEEKFNKWNAKILGFALQEDSVAPAGKRPYKTQAKQLVKGVKYRKPAEKKPRRCVKGILTKKLESNLSFLNINKPPHKTDERSTTKVILENGSQTSGTSIRSEPDKESVQTFVPTQIFPRPKIPLSAQTLKEKWVSNLSFLGVNMKEEERQKRRQNQNAAIRGPGTLTCKLEQNLQYLGLGNSKDTIDGRKHYDGLGPETESSSSIRLSRYPGRSADEPEDMNDRKQFSIKTSRPKGRGHTEELNNSFETTNMKPETVKHTQSHNIEREKIYKTNFETENSSIKQPRSTDGHVSGANTYILKPKPVVKQELDTTNIFHSSKEDIHGDIMNNNHSVCNMEKNSNRSDSQLWNRSENQLLNDEDIVSNHTSLKLKLAACVRNKEKKTTENVINTENHVKNDMDLDDDLESYENKHMRNCMTMNIINSKHDEIMDLRNAEENQQLNTSRKTSCSSRMKQNKTVKLLKKSEELPDWIGVRSPVKTRSCSLEEHNTRKISHCKSVRKSRSSEGQSTKGSKQCKRRRRQRRLIQKKSGQQNDVPYEKKTSFPRNSSNQIVMPDKGSKTLKLESIVHDEPFKAEQKVEELTDLYTSFENKTEANTETMAWHCDFEMSADANEADNHNTDRTVTMPADLKTEPNLGKHARLAGSEFYLHNQPLTGFVPVICMRQPDHMHRLENSLLNKVDSGMHLTDTERAVLEVSETVNDYLRERQDAHYVLYDFQTNIEQMQEESLWVMIHALLSKLGASNAVYSRLLAISQKSSAETKIILQVFLDLLYYELYGKAAECSVDIINTVSDIAQQLRYREEFS